MSEPKQEPVALQVPGRAQKAERAAHGPPSLHSATDCGTQAPCSPPPSPPPSPPSPPPSSGAPPPSSPSPGPGVSNSISFLLSLDKGALTTQAMPLKNPRPAGTSMASRQARLICRLAWATDVYLI